VGNLSEVSTKPVSWGKSYPFKSLSGSFNSIGSLALLSYAFNASYKLEYNLVLPSREDITLDRRIRIV
jgi:hypothetical protein